MADASFARGHTDPTTVPPWMYEEVALELGGYMAAAYLAGVEVGRAAERAEREAAPSPSVPLSGTAAQDEEARKP